MIGAPTSAGAYGPGQERAPEVFRKHGLIEALRTDGLEVRDLGDVPGAAWRIDDASPKARNVETVAQVAAAVAKLVESVFADNHNVFVLGGDCTVELGTVTGAVADGSTVALAYIDLDADLNTPLTGDGVLDWMGVAHLLAAEGADTRLATLGAIYPLLPPDALNLVAVDNITVQEQQVIERFALRHERLRVVRDDPDGAIARIIAWASPYDRLLVHLDVDVLDYEDFPIAENTGRRGGLQLPELARLLKGLCAATNWRGLTLTEVNPAHASDEEQAFAALNSMLANAMRVAH